MQLWPHAGFAPVVLCAPCVNSYLFNSFTKAKCSSAVILLSSLAFSSSHVEHKASSCFWYSVISSSWLCFLSSKTTICLVNFEAFGRRKKESQLSIAELIQPLSETFNKTINLDLIFCCLKQLVLEKYRNVESTSFQCYKLIKMSFYSEKFWLSLTCSLIMQMNVLLFNISSQLFRRSKSKWSTFYNVKNIFLKYQLASRVWCPINVTYIQEHFLGTYEVAKKPQLTKTKTPPSLSKQKVTIENKNQNLQYHLYCSSDD